MPVPLFIRQSLARLTKLAWKQAISSKRPGTLTSPHSTSSDKVLEFVDPASVIPGLADCACRPDFTDPCAYHCPIKLSTATARRCSRTMGQPETSAIQPSQPHSRSLIQVPLDVFSSVWTGIVLLSLLFIYSSIGSAYPPLRQLPMFEMTEFEWFHWWPFKTLISLICLTLVVTTVRRIPFKVINYGVWMIHTGIITLAIGSVWYFGTKVEGQAPILRRAVVIEVPGAAPVRLPAVPGNSTTVHVDNRIYAFQISEIDPSWEILSGDDAGKRAYAVSVAVQDGQEFFVRQLLAGYPQYTEDIIRSDDPNQPMVRAKKVLGKPLVNEDITLSLDYQPQKYFHVVDSWALYLREQGSSEWVQRPIEGLPRYNDYFADRSHVWLPPDMAGPRPNPLDILVEPITDDPYHNIDVRITSYLRYAFMDQRRSPGGNVLDPTAVVVLRSSDGRTSRAELVALDPSQNNAIDGNLVFQWITAEEQLQTIMDVQPPALQIRVPGASIEITEPVTQLVSGDPDTPFIPIEGSEFSYRVRFIQDGLTITPGDVISVAAVEINGPDSSFLRWVCDDPRRTRDMSIDVDTQTGHMDILPTDERIVMEYDPGHGPAPMTLIGGPDDSTVRLMTAFAGQEPHVQPMEIGRPIDIGAGVTLSLTEYIARPRIEVRPAIIPRSQRNRDAREQFSMIRAEVNYQGAMQPVWLPFHMFTFQDAGHSLPRMGFQPTVVHLPDGKHIEMIFGRRRLELPAPVVLEDFVMDTHVGGFTGQAISVLNWISLIRFQEQDEWGEQLHVSVNSPQQFGGFSYFQSQWDPPDPQSNYRGMNYTVLGVGNRHGVNVQLAGTCLAVLGMIYAFYIKPVIKRRRQQAVYAQASAERAASKRAQPPGAPNLELEPVATLKEQT